MPVAKSRSKYHPAISATDPINIGWTSNAPFATTGYGMQTAQTISRFKRDGHNVAVFSNYGLEGITQDWDSGYGDVPIYPRGADLYSNDVVPAHMHDFTQRNPELDHILFTLYDVWVYKGEPWDRWNVASWIPIDHMPTPPAVSAWARRDNVTPIAMSQYGQRMLENVGIPALYVPHAVEKVFIPTESVNGITGRDYMKCGDDVFVVGMNAANKGVMPNRKAFGENLLAFSLFAKNKKDVKLYMHTDFFGSLGGIKMAELITALGIPKEQITFVDPYLYRMGIDQQSLASIYTAMDVLLATSYGEGFGVPTIEAQACGTPVIVSDFAASTELLGDGWLVDGQPLWDAPQSSFFQVPSVAGIVAALEEAYARGRGRSQKAIDFVSAYDADTVYNEHWKPALQVLRKKSQERA